MKSDFLNEWLLSRRHRVLWFTAAFVLMLVVALFLSTSTVSKAPTEDDTAALRGSANQDESSPQTP